MSRDAPFSTSVRSRAPGLLFYSHDTYGLGHLRRTLALARHLRSRRPLSQLIATGSPLAHRFPLPLDADYLKLPSAVKVGAGAYEARSLALPFGALRALRRDVLRAAAAHFRPSLLLVDNVPGGLKGELVPTLRELKEAGCRLVLGLRDIVDEDEWVRRSWTEDGSYELLDDVYDRILVYGEREIYDAASAYGFSATAAEKTRFVGYIGREGGRRRPEQVRAELGVNGRKLALVMAGGGGDGAGLLRSVVRALGRANRRFELVLLGGPLLPADERRELAALAGESSVRYLDFVDDVSSHLAAADVVVSMGGYNSVCELLTLGTPALVVPRVEPRREQLIRARLLASRGFLRMLHPEELGPKRLLAEVDGLLDSPPPPRLLMNGLAGAAQAIDELLAREPRLAMAAGGARG